MPVYRFTFEVQSERGIPGRTLKALWEEQQKYLRTVLLPQGSPDQVRFRADVPSHQQLNANGDTYPIHQHFGISRCSACRDMSTDGRGE